MQQPTDTSDVERLAWAAGFLDGDGCLSRSAGYPMISIAGIDPEPLENFRQAVGAGHVVGPYVRSHPDRWSKKPQYFVQIYKEAIGVVQRLWPHLGSAKRAQALRHAAWDAADLPQQPAADEASHRKKFSRENLAWAAGFFDAEGCFSTTARVGVCASITQTNRELLDRFQSTVGLGKVYGPYQTHASDRYRRKPHYFFRAHGRERVQALLAMLWTWLGTAKRQQAVERLDWPTTCRRGRPKNPGHAGCAECTRAYWAGYRSRNEGDSVGEPGVPYLLAAG